MAFASSICKMAATTLLPATDETEGQGNLLRDSMTDNVREARRELFVVLILWLITLGLFAFVAICQLI
jgi:hypothetical protein